MLLVMVQWCMVCNRFCSDFERWSTSTALHSWRTFITATPRLLGQFPTKNTAAMTRRNCSRWRGGAVVPITRCMHCMGLGCDVLQGPAWYIQGSSYLLCQRFRACFVLKFELQMGEGETRERMQISKQDTQNLWTKKVPWAPYSMLESAEIVEKAMKVGLGTQQQQTNVRSPDLIDQCLI